MSPTLLPLYLASFALIGLLAFFARVNRRTGWVRERSTLLRDLFALQEVWNEEEVSRAKAAAPAAQTCPEPQPDRLLVPKLSSTEVFEFTRQLAAMSSGLQRSAKAPAPDHVAAGR